MSSDHTQKLRQAAQLSKEGDFEGARKLLMHVLKEDPKNVTAWLGIAKVTKSPIDRRKALNTILQLQPDHERARALLDKLDAQYPANDEEVDFEERSLEFPIPKSPPAPTPLEPAPTQTSPSQWHSQETLFSVATPQHQPNFNPSPFVANAPWNSYPYPAPQPTQPNTKRRRVIMGLLLSLIPTLIMLLIASSDKWSMLDTQDILALLGASLFGTGAAIYVGQTIINVVVQQSVEQNATTILHHSGSSGMRWLRMMGAMVLLTTSIVIGAVVINIDATDNVGEPLQDDIVGLWTADTGLLGYGFVDFRPDGTLFVTYPFSPTEEHRYFVSGDQVTLIFDPGTSDEYRVVNTIRVLDETRLILWSEEDGLFTYIRVR